MCVIVKENLKLFIRLQFGYIKAGVFKMLSRLIVGSDKSCSDKQLDG
jgi:hypothetical protein